MELEANTRTNKRLTKPKVPGNRVLPLTSAIFTGKDTEVCGWYAR